MGAQAIGRYACIRLLGSGGMGEVWEALDPELNRRVALKLLRDTDADSLARFKREARMAATLNHPNIAPIYEVGEAAGRHYIAMQLVEGRTLKEHPRGDRRARRTGAGRIPAPCACACEDLNEVLRLQIYRRVPDATGEVSRIFFLARPPPVC